MEANPFAQPGKLKVRGRKVDMAGSASIPTSSAGSPITSRLGRAYVTARLYGGARSAFALSNGGHVQSLVNPPGNARSWFGGAARAAQPPKLG
jgi:polyhydroxyalkanoate synthase